METNLKKKILDEALILVSENKIEEALLCLKSAEFSSVLNEFTVFKLREINLLKRELDLSIITIEDKNTSENMIAVELFQVLRNEKNVLSTFYDNSVTEIGKKEDRKVTLNFKRFDRKDKEDVKGIDLYIDNEKVIELFSSQRLSIKIKPGKYKIHAIAEYSVYYPGSSRGFSSRTEDYSIVSETIQVDILDENTTVALGLDSKLDSSSILSWLVSRQDFEIYLKYT